MVLVNFSYLTVCFLKFLQSEIINFRGQRFLHYLVTQLETLKFAVDWNKIGGEAGGKKFKGRFTRDIYQARTGRVAPDSENASREDIRAFRLFKSHQQKIIMARNYLLEMYKTVRTYKTFFLGFN